LHPFHLTLIFTHFVGFHDGISFATPKNGMSLKKKITTFFPSTSLNFFWGATWGNRKNHAGLDQITL